jgi:3-oxoacyl-[acyl-carrier protein] reductase
MSQGRLQGRVALITGGSRGIGKATAVKMVREGASVVLLDILSKEVSQAARELKAMGGNALAIHADVSQRKEVDKAVGKALSKWRRVDILVNNAGIVRPALLENVKEEDLDEMIR